MARPGIEPNVMPPVCFYIDVCVKSLSHLAVKLAPSASAFAS